MTDLTVEGMTVYREESDLTHFFGEVCNGGEDAQRWVRVTVQLYDQSGAQVVEGEDITALEWVLPGSKVPFHVRFQDSAPNWQTYTLRITGTVHDYADAEVPQPHVALMVDHLHLMEIGRGKLCCSLIGMISNPSDIAASRVKVAGTLYGPDRRVVGVLSPYVAEDPFAPGARALFELKYYYLAGPVVDYAVLAQGRRADR
ncbi:MAG: FxLYD domain-containing protein [Anaerolineae bacterium]